MSSFVIAVLAGIIVAFIVMPWLEKKVWAYMQSTEGGLELRKVDHIVTFAVIGLFVSVVQCIMWAVQLLAWAVHQFV
jgi:hypothetical protein